MEFLNKLSNNKLSNSALHKSNNIKNNNAQLPKEGVIKGEVVDVKGLDVKILTAEGQYISGKMTDANILNMGEQKAFEVYFENGHAKMRPLSLSSNENKLIQIKKALADLGIVNSEIDEAIAKELMNNELPVNEKMLKDLSRLLKLFNATEGAKNSENEKNINLFDSSQNINEQPSEKNNSLLPNKNIDKGVFILKNEIPVNLKNANLVTQFSNNEVNLQNEFSNISNDINTLTDVELKQTLQNIINFNDESGVNEKNIFSKTNLSNLQSILKNTTGEKLLNLLNKEINNANQNENVNVNVNVNVNGNTNANVNTNTNINSNTFNIQDLLTLSKHELKELLKDTNKSELVKIIKDNVNNSDFSFKLNNGTLQEMDDFFEETTTKFEKLLQQLQSKDDDTLKQLFNKLVDVKDKMDFGNHIKSNIFLQLPININEHKTNGQLTIFKDKRKKGCKDVSSALISLDTKSLGVFETFIQKQNNNLNLQFKLENKEVESIVKTHLTNLKSTLSLLRYNIESISFKTKEESFSVLNTEKGLINANFATLNPNTTFEANA